MKISVIGLGYIGLPTAAVLASKGVEVIGVEINEKTVDIINSGKIHIVEPELDKLVHATVKQGKLKATLEPEKSDVFIIAVPTPFKDGNKPDLSYVNQAVKNISPFLEKGNLIILESTSPVGTTDQISKWLTKERRDLKFPSENADEIDVNIAYCPERVLPGHIIHELVLNDRIIGGLTSGCSIKAKEIYKIFVEGECILTNSRTAEMCKLTENAFRDVNIAFANELSIISDKLNIDVWELISLTNRHPRVNVLKPGPGVGGHCIAVDPWFIVDSAPSESKLIRMARQINDAKPIYVLDRVKEAIRDIGKDVSEISIVCLGLAFKANIDDLRESPALEIANSISQFGMKATYIVEPNIKILPDSLLKNTILTDLKNGVEKSEIVVILVDHDQFKDLDNQKLSRKKIIDTRGIMSKF